MTDEELFGEFDVGLDDDEFDAVGANVDDDGDVDDADTIDEFAESPWRRTPTARTQNKWTHSTSGAVRYSKDDPGGKGRAKGAGNKETAADATPKTVDMNDHKKFVDLLHREAADVRHWTGRKMGEGLGSDTHPVYVSDLYDAVKDQLTGDVTLTDFKRQLLALHIDDKLSLSRNDIPQAGVSGGAQDSEIEHQNATFHLVNTKPPKPVAKPDPDGDGASAKGDDSGGSAKTPAKAPAKPTAKPSARDAKAADQPTTIAKVNAILAGEKSPEAARDLVTHLAKLTVVQLNAIKKLHGFRAGGKKAELVEKIAAMGNKEPAPAKPAPKAAATPAEKPVAKDGANAKMPANAITTMLDALDGADKGGEKDEPKPATTPKTASASASPPVPHDAPPSTQAGLSGDMATKLRTLGRVDTHILDDVYGDWGLDSNEAFRRFETINNTLAGSGATQERVDKAVNGAWDEVKGVADAAEQHGRSDVADFYRHWGAKIAAELKQAHSPSVDAKDAKGDTPATKSAAEKPVKKSATKPATKPDSTPVVDAATIERIYEQASRGTRNGIPIGEITKVFDDPALMKMPVSQMKQVASKLGVPAALQHTRASMIKFMRKAAVDRHGAIDRWDADVIQDDKYTKAKASEKLTK